MAEALHSLRWKAFCESLPEDAQAYDKKVEHLHVLFPSQQYAVYQEDEEFQAMMAAYQNFVQRRSSDATFAFWSSVEPSHGSAKTWQVKCKS